jgi:hypothetical protein
VLKRKCLLFKYSGHTIIATLAKVTLLQRIQITNFLATDASAIASKIATAGFLIITLNSPNVFTLTNSLENTVNDHAYIDVVVDVEQASVGKQDNY